MLRPIAPFSFPDITIVPTTTARPTFVDVAPTALLVDEDYQRGLSDRSRQLIRRMIASWDWRAFKPPVVVMVDGGYHVIDGQHTAIVAASRGEPTIPVQVVEAGEIADRAAAFVKTNRDRIAVTPHQLHHALVAAGDEDAMTVEQVCQRAGAKLLRYPPANGLYEVGDLMAIGALKTLVRRRYAVGARRVLDICVAAKLAPVSAGALKAVEFCLYEPGYTGQVTDEDLATALRELGPRGEQEAVIFATEHGLPHWRSLAVILFRNTRKSRGRNAQA